MAFTWTIYKTTVIYWKSLNNQVITRQKTINFMRKHEWKQFYHRVEEKFYIIFLDFPLGVIWNCYNLKINYESNHVLSYNYNTTVGQILHTAESFLCFPVRLEIPRISSSLNSHFDLKIRSSHQPFSNIFDTGRKGTWTWYINPSPSYPSLQKYVYFSWKN